MFEFAGYSKFSSCEAANIPIWCCSTASLAVCYTYLPMHLD